MIRELCSDAITLNPPRMNQQVFNIIDNERPFDNDESSSAYSKTGVSLKLT